MTHSAEAYRPRLADPYLRDLMGSFPALMITGARATGKTTTARQHVVAVDRLDVPGTASAYQADPDSALRRAQKPLLVDEWQEVPGVLAAVKRAVDADSSPGQYLLTGSVRAQLTNETWAGTGRLIRMSMHGLTEREIAGPEAMIGPAFLDKVLTGNIDGLRLPPTPPALDDYVEMAVRGGFPDAAFKHRAPRAQRLWYASYIDDLITRDAAVVGHLKDPTKLRSYLTVLALNTAGLPTDASLYGAAGINAKTAAGYDQLLTNLYVLDLVPAWPATGNKLKALVKASKRYLLDTGLTAAAAALSAADIVNDPALLGRIFDAFGTAQLRAEIGLRDERVQTHHLRTDGGRHEIDLVLDMGRGRAIGIVFKAASTVTPHDFRHLRALAADLGDDFLAGIVLYTGSHVVQLGPRLYGIPLCALWS